MSVVKTPQELLSAVPFLLGFHPENSIVVISVKDDSLEMAMRIDYPQLDEQGLAGLNIVEHTPANDGVLIVGYLPNENLDEETAFLDTLGNLFAMDNKYNVREILAVWDGKYRSLLCQDETCCPVEGTPVPEFKDNRITAEQVAQGKPLPFASNEVLVASLEANDTAKDKDFIALVKSFAKPKGMDEKTYQQEGARAIDEVFTLANQNTALPKELIAKVLGHLTDIQVRDYALGASNDAELAHATYLEISKYAPKGFVSPITCLTGAYAYEIGNGAEAHRLLDRAMQDDEDYTLARLLRRVFASGWPVEGFAQLRGELHARVSATIFG